MNGSDCRSANRARMQRGECLEGKEEQDGRGAARGEQRRMRDTVRADLDVLAGRVRHLPVAEVRQRVRHRNRLRDAKRNQGGEYGERSAAGTQGLHSVSGDIILAEHPGLCRAGTPNPRLHAIFGAAPDRSSSISTLSRKLRLNLTSWPDCRRRKHSPFTCGRSERTRARLTIVERCTRWKTDGSSMSSSSFIVARSTCVWPPACRHM